MCLSGILIDVKNLQKFDTMLLLLLIYLFEFCNNSLKLLRQNIRKYLEQYTSTAKDGKNRKQQQQ